MAVASSRTGHTYQIQRSPDLSEGSWTSEGAAQAGTDGPLQFTLPILLQEKRFCRIAITLQ